MSNPQLRSAALQGAQGRLDFQAVTKRYGPTVALSEFTHSFAPGQVHALMGKNGSGKSTLVKLLAGVTEPTSGTISVNGEDRRFTSPHDAFAAGIVTVHQELSLVPELSVGENIFLGRLPHRRRAGFSVVDWVGLHRRAGELLADMGLTIDSRQPVSALSVGQQQVVEIVKAMSFNPSILLLDEPTSALASREVKQLFTLIERLRARGVTMIYITHRMSELFEIADTCTVIRDGHYIGAVAMKETTPSAIVGMMFGDAARATRPPRRTLDRAEPVLEVRNLSRSGHFQDVSFDLYPGEILGIAGLLGAGRTELMRAIFGADPVDGGSVMFNGRDMTGASPRDMRKAGLGYTPENRKEVGLVQSLSTADNLCMASLGPISSGGFISRRREQPFVRRQITALHIKCGDPELPVSSLSGGNQQKVVIGKWLNRQPSVMFFDEPSRGVDVQAKSQIFDIIWQKAADGLASIFVSTELEEVLEVADRILVMHHGEVVAEVDPAKTDLTELYGLCMEGARQ
ncbi:MULTISPECIES: sugar ABC transporter ATP-binding protein [Rhizobium/Agrobacterium group]|uniref:sugar ABC transporter ATP-binding protein n=1 Tax=Rhizobium/Agrobacterium group TaxID=227290 RepID=UPI0022FFDA8C|nr:MULTISPECIES: sugar ABC transporter ATP-binding protein [Rhizobium/Agrobacterium group]MDA5633236.1 sugar ABC transporter ATP-binding protein [Agrobacterium sp. ST15.16.024]MDF1888879.1 sugar ABC transporter ATP-binding protein [Rhizobium rhizogenes]